MEQINGKKILMYLGLGVVGVYFLMLLFGCGWEIVDTGHRGVKTEFGKVISESLPEGIYFYNPFTQGFVEMDCRTQVAHLETETYTRDVQQGKMKYTVNYTLDPSKAHEMYRLVGKKWEEKLLLQVFEGTLKSVIGKWDAVDLISNRDKARAEAEKMMLDVLKEKFVTVEKLELTNIDYNDAFEGAVEAKVVAIQRSIEQQNKTKQVEEQSKQTIIAAKAEAESMRIRANALTQNKGLVDYEAVMKWNGVLPVTMLGNATPFINIK
jgi:prohibitin 2